MSSYGGFFGGALGAIVFLYATKSTRKWEYIDALIAGIAAAWFFGRLGCTIVHDHPGKRTDFFLAVNFPDGPRHDLGFYEWLFTIFINIVLLLFWNKRLCSPGMTIGIVCACYGPARFVLDFLRIDDKRYSGLTPAQYASIVLTAFGVWLLVTRGNRRNPVVGKSSRRSVCVDAETPV